MCLCFGTILYIVQFNLKARACRQYQRLAGIIRTHIKWDWHQVLIAIIILKHRVLYIIGNILRFLGTNLYYTIGGCIFLDIIQVGGATTIQLLGHSRKLECGIINTCRHTHLVINCSYLISIGSIIVISIFQAHLCRTKLVTTLAYKCYTAGNMAHG